MTDNSVQKLNEDEQPKVWNKLDEVAVALIMLPICLVAIYVLKDASVPIITSAITALGMYLTGKQKNGS